MSRPIVQVDAARRNRSLIASASPRPRLSADPVLLAWRRLIDSAVADAKRTRNGLPTANAILARWWIEEHKPKPADAVDWERSFECACSWLGLNAGDERKRLLLTIDAALKDACLNWAQCEVYQLRAEVLSCAGVPTSIARQLVLPLVAEDEYEDVAGVDRDDPPNAKPFLPLKPAA
jgi:hypothetical protein